MRTSFGLLFIASTPSEEAQLLGRQALAKGLLLGADRLWGELLEEGPVLPVHLLHHPGQTFVILRR